MSEPLRAWVRDAVIGFEHPRSVREGLQQLKRSKAGVLVVNRPLKGRENRDKAYEAAIKKDVVQMYRELLEVGYDEEEAGILIGRKLVERGREERRDRQISFYNGVIMGQREVMKEKRENG